MVNVFGISPVPDFDDERVVALFDAHYPQLVHAARLMLNNTSDAEDVVQEAFTRFFVSRRRLREYEKAPAYLRSAVFDIARSRMRRRSTERKYEPSLQTDVLRRADQLPDSAALVQVQSDALALALQVLSERQRECVVLRYYMGLNESEISDTLGISKGSVKSHLSRGIHALKLKLGGDVDGSG